MSQQDTSRSTTWSFIPRTQIVKEDNRPLQVFLTLPHIYSGLHTPTHMNQHTK